jgi:tetratricopeptide (TPR) repeat protein
LRSNRLSLCFRAGSVFLILMTEKSNKVLSFPSPAPPKADYQRVKSSYSTREIKQLFGLSERTIRRWSEQGIIQAEVSTTGKDFTYDFHALTQFRRVRELRSQGLSIKQIEFELQGQLSLFRAESAPVTRLLTPFEEALALDEQGDPRAADFYAEAISEGDNIAEAYCNLGIVELGKGDATKALDSFTLALKHEPRHLEGHYNLASLYYDIGDFRLALLHYEAAAIIEPAFSRAHYNLALVYDKLNDWDKALDALKKYLELEPDDPEMMEFNELLKLRDMSRRGK